MPRSKWSVAFEPALSLLVGSTAKAVVTDVLLKPYKILPQWNYTVFPNRK